MGHHPQSNTPADIAGHRTIERQCLACRQMFPREQMLRLLHNRQHKTTCLLKPFQKHEPVSGRSAYLCLSESCLSVALKGKKIQKALKTSVSDDIVNCLKDVLKGIHASGHRQS